MRCVSIGILGLCCLTLQVNHTHGWHPNLSLQNFKPIPSFLATACSLQLILCPTGPCQALTTTAATSTDNTQQGQLVQIWKCPESFATQSLGIQNIPSTVVPQKTQKEQAYLRQCSNSELSNERSIVRGLIYMPSTSTPVKSLYDTKENSLSTTLFITVSSTTKPSVFLAGAQIPMSEIQDFPISFSLGRNNIVENMQESFETLQDSDLYVTAEIRSSSGIEFFKGRGMARMLLLPTTDEKTSMAVRAAASIRLSQPTSADILYSW